VVNELATFDTGEWSEVARVDLDPPGTLAVFQADPDETIRYLIFRQGGGSAHWYGQYQSGHFPSLEEALADAIQWRG
jgi:hypothetical protein